MHLGCKTSFAAEKFISFFGDTYVSVAVMFVCIVLFS